MVGGSWEVETYVGSVAYHVGFLVFRKHHECQHYKEEKNGIHENAERSRATGGIGGSCEIQPSHNFIDDFVGFRVGTEEKHQGAVEAVFSF